MTANTSTSPVSLDDERSIRDGETAAEEYVRSTSRARDQIIPMARGLLAAKRRYPATQEFGEWLSRSPSLTIGKTDRAALINIAEYELTIARFLRKTTLISPELIWTEYGDAAQALASSDHRNSAEPPQLAEIPQNVAPIAPPAQTATARRGRTFERMYKSNPFYGRDRADEVLAIYSDAHARVHIGRVLGVRGGDALWAMILTAIDAGLLTKTGYTAATERLSLRVLFPDERAKNYCRGIDLSTAQEIKRVRDFILPAMVANKDAILADPSQIAQIMNRAEYDARIKANEAAAVARLTERRAALPTHEHEVVMYGEVFWPNPRPDVIAYTYDQCRAACWYFYETDQLYKVTAGGGDDVKGRAMMMRFSTRWFAQYADREMSSEDRDRIKRVFQLVHAMANAMEINPTGASRRPPSPTTDGEWP
ncbi:MAG TPA: hypothetical protein VFE60_27770 [Roseiarcus sp.]|jgi:hypothetical protein|nr:hypothetical protein [Roseiarcus sp.]